MAKENNNLRIPPQNLEAERAVLGAILLGEEALNDALEILIKEDFYDNAKTGQIYQSNRFMVTS